MTFGIGRYIGSWRDAEGYRLDITKVDDVRASVSLQSPSGSPIEPPYFETKPTVDMIADYDEHTGTLQVHLWTPDAGFVLELLHELAYELDECQREALVPGLSQYEEDTFLNKYHGLFGRLVHYTRDH